MADHALVEQVLAWLDNWDTSNADKPTLIDRDDAESVSFAGRQVSYDLTDNHAVSAASTPDRQTEPIGTEYDHRVEDAVSLRLEGAHADEHGTIASAQEWQAIVNEAKRVILTERTSYPTLNGTDYHTVRIKNEQNLAAETKDYYRYDVDVVFRGYDDLP